VLDLLLSEHLLIVQGTGFNWPRPDHVRIVTLPHLDDLQDAIERFGRFLDRRRGHSARTTEPPA
jgi:alanine-synthesizing transaminase